MSKKLNTEIFIERAKKIHGDKYDYSLVQYNGSKNKVGVICKKHGVFEQRVDVHLNGTGCKKCSIISSKNKKTIGTNEFIKRAKEIHNNKYDYSLVEYKRSNLMIKIICPIHGVFEQQPSGHLNGYGCSKCGYNTRSNNLKNGKEHFIEKVQKIYNNKYDYSLVEYKGMNVKVKIICHEHGIFEQTPNNHYSCKGCKKCTSINKKDKILLNKNDFIKRSNETHEYKYNYSFVEYKNSKTKVKIICPIHNIFKQKPIGHMNGQGCPKCKSSNGEKQITLILNNNKIKYETQKTFSKCKNIRHLKFDFYIEDYNLCIEYDGEQHFKPIKYWGGELNYLNTLKKDKIKNDFCKREGINLLRIKYDENIEEKLNNYFKPT